MTCSRPDAWLIGEEGSGWQQLTAELALERAGPERYLSTFAVVRGVRREPCRRAGAAVRRTS